MAELLEVDVVEGKSVVAQVGEDVFEEVGVSVVSKLHIVSLLIGHFQTCQ